MTVKRNDPCPCGSGKKYKKCCLNQAKVVQIHEVREERFLQSKHLLVLKLKEFITKKVSATQYYQLQAEFKKRTLHAIKGKYETGFFEFWLFFFHRFENGLRGIEWFNQESRLTAEEMQMAKTWEELTPKFVQAVDKKDEIIVFEDMDTKEQYRVPMLKDTDPAYIPWYGTFALLEPYNDLFYFNGVRVFEDPYSLSRAMKKVEEFTESTKQSREQVMFDYFPEILAALITDQDAALHEKREIHDYLLDYKVEDDEAVTSFLQGQEQFIIDTWEENKKLCSWIDCWYSYTDTEISGPVLIAEIFGKIFLENGHLQFTSLDFARVEEFKQMIKSLLDRKALTFIEEKTKTFSIPVQAEIRDMVLSLEPDTPPYFGVYAQHDIRLEFDKPIRQFNGLSIKELIEEGRVEEAEHWLKQMEYSTYQAVKQQNKEVIATADYNSIRRMLGLPLSPFVTGGETRQSQIEKLGAPNHGEGTKAVKKEDIPYYEQLGFTPDTIDNFYAEDFIAFFKEKTEGKSENTIRKYRSSLEDLRLILEQSNNTSWDDCDQAFWKRVFTMDFTGLYEILTKTAIKDFISVTKALAKWLDQKQKSTSLSKTVVKVTKDTEEELLRSLESIVPV
ncbi:YecA family protein [uncultured Metabacillus sp.]|uniref:YecA family protein n=1 Tax=uncultured Metabacillus sp. TaxID=2860135 RepID=UPI0026081CAE|nr:SEC-C domain-containing protein [uncultured Metabacillus sp.]